MNLTIFIIKWLTIIKLFSAMTSEAFTNFLCEICFLLAYRFQIAGYRDVHEYRDVKQKEPVSSSRFHLLQECVLVLLPSHDP